MGNATLAEVSLKPFIPGVFMAPVFAVSFATEGCVYGALLGYTVGAFAWMYHVFSTELNTDAHFTKHLTDNVGIMATLFLATTLGCLLGATCEVVGRRIWRNKVAKSQNT